MSRSVANKRLNKANNYHLTSINESTGLSDIFARCGWTIDAVFEMALVTIHRLIKHSMASEVKTND